MEKNGTAARHTQEIRLAQKGTGAKLGSGMECRTTTAKAIGIRAASKPKIRVPIRFIASVISVTQVPAIRQPTYACVHMPQQTGLPPA
jgi:hypothetical protein